MIDAYELRVLKTHIIIWNYIVITHIVYLLEPFSNLRILILDDALHWEWELRLWNRVHSNNIFIS